MSDSPHAPDTILDDEQQQSAEAHDLRAVLLSILPNAEHGNQSRDPDTQPTQSVASRSSSILAAFDLSSLLSDPPADGPVKLTTDETSFIQAVLKGVHDLRLPLTYDSTIAILFAVACVCVDT